MRVRWLGAIVVALGVLIFLAACNNGDDVVVPADDSAPPAAGTTVASAPPARTPVPATGPCGGSLEGCFNYSQMPQFFSVAVQLVAAFFESAYPNLPRPANIVFVPDGEVGRSACIDQRGRPALFTDQSYEYCPADFSIYVGQQSLWAFYRLGDAAPVAGIAHEWGHHVQHILNVPKPTTSAQSILYESQADCISGAWVKHASDTNVLEYPDDVEDLGAMLQAIASAESPDREHGSLRERTAAFELGFNSGLRGCNRFFPQTPIAR